MIRTFSHLALGVLAATMLGGCTISIQSGSGHAPAHQQPPPPPPRPAVPARTAARPAPKPAQPRPTPTRRPPLVLTPRVKTATVFGNGTTGAFHGLAYVIPNGTQQLPQFEGLVPFATVYTDRFDIQPQDFSSGFPGALLQNEWFGIRYEGAFQVPSAGVWHFRLTADDGAILYVDGRRVVVNDGVHTARNAEGEAELAAGTHRLRLDYFQGSRGQVALILLVGQKGKLAPLVGTR